jgi:hypothetical protein
MLFKTNDLFFKIILIIIAIGIWGLFLQNAGVISIKQTVYVKGGYIDAEVSGSVDISGSVEVDNTVSVSIDEVLGKDNKKYYFNNR